MSSINKEKIIAFKNKANTYLNEHKKIFLIGSVIFIVMIALSLNIQMFQMNYAIRQGNDAQVIQLLKQDVQKEYKQSENQFKKGIKYLTSHISEEGSTFFEAYFAVLIPKVQMQVIDAYNEHNVVFRQNQDVFHAAALEEQSESYRTYMRRLSVEEIERGLKNYLGETPKLTQDVVNRLYQVLSLQSQKINLQIFKPSLYELMSFPHNGDINSTSLKVLEYIQPEAIKENLFAELKTQSIELELFATWIDILNKKKVITTAEYASFTTSYGNIRRLQEQYKQTLMQEVDLINIKQMIDVQTEEITNQMTKLTKELDTLTTQLANEEEVLYNLKTYKEMELYVLDRYENGDYEVAIPERSWLFGTYKPGTERIRLKATASVVEGQGVHSFLVYNKGTSPEGLPYYIEVSVEELEAITAVEEKISHLKDTVQDKENEIAKCTQEINQIRITNNYDQTLLSLEEIERKKGSTELEIKKEKISIQNHFQIGELIVEIKK